MEIKETKPVHLKGNQLWILFEKYWCWRWSSNTLGTRYEELTHWKRPWCWERLRAGGEGDNRGWDSWMVSAMQWTWTWANSRRWWGTGKPGMLQCMGLLRLELNLATEQQQQFKTDTESQNKELRIPLDRERELLWNSSAEVDLKFVIPNLVCKRFKEFQPWESASPKFSPPLAVGRAWLVPSVGASHSLVFSLFPSFRDGVGSALYASPFLVIISVLSS